MTTPRPTAAHAPARPLVSWNLLPGILLAASGFLLFGLDERPAGYLTLAVSLVAAVAIDRALAKDLLLIAIGLTAISLVPINTDIEWGHMLLMGAALAAAVLLPYLISRFVYRDHAIRFPVWTGKRWSRFEFGYLVAVVILGWFLLPVYMIPTGVYENWPAASDPGSIARLFLGTNALGIWDELFFICTTFALLRRHFPDWQANLLQAVLFTSFLWELGFHSWGPFLIYPFAVLQGWIFRQTKSLSYIVSVHLLFDFVLFLVLLHAHNRDWLAIFLY
ncbi:membrane protease YdiL (CAAX protease family) [Okibacterium sp. HSC-33S16]|uniref:CPBP family intramembrane metalloprotease n=1 Tax=Okibacterium sp. HSC-33S16 TaxID=2910965 RepID=UPI00209CD054|nr:CPBP family intramembrane metalloprotease [Okibacterium sp. HSC-33S16]MCP2030254.1 membrane protease YdiL (CAAX protease family) [Okibacterium sp. HSC-33S16]